ncbi:Abi family protein, partial [Acinetobacter baumannii]|nr:Abi family protein [Acinetobacter baumannii]
MAQSQAIFTYNNDGQEIIDSLSKERFETYLERAGYKKSYAFELYLYNSRLAKSFLFPLQMLEVSVRNSINNLFIKEFGIDWVSDVQFRKILNVHSLSSLDKAIERSKSSNNWDIVSNITFDFWSNLFRDEYDRPLWQTRIHLLFFGNVTRKKIQKELEDLNILRNRIAHHEPILKLDLSKLYSRLLNVLDLISRDLKQWVQHFGTVNEIIRTKPSKHGNKGPFFNERHDDNFCLIKIDTPLSEIPNQRFLICKDEAEKSVIEHSDIGSYVLSLADENYELIINLKDLKIKDLLDKSPNLINNFNRCSGTESFSSCNLFFKGKNINYI